MAGIIPLNRLPVFSIINPPVSEYDFAKGAVFLIDKPIGWSSFEVVKLLRNYIGGHKTGHTGTLDPMATGLLLLCCGKATRTIPEIQQKLKTYLCEIVFGASTPSFDSETEVEQTMPFAHITRNQLQQVLSQQFTGEILQTPPMYSAVKQKGKPLYKLARQGKTVERQPRKVTVYQARIVSFNLPEVELYIKCNSGMYVRSLANELGKKMNSLAYLSTLKRRTIGEFNLSNALTIQDLKLIFS